MGQKILFHLAVGARLTGDSTLKFQKVKVQDANVLGANFGLKCKVQQVCPAAADTAHRGRKGWRVRTPQSRETEVTRTTATPRCSSPHAPSMRSRLPRSHPSPTSFPFSVSRAHFTSRRTTTKRLQSLDGCVGTWGVF